MARQTKGSFMGPKPVCYAKIAAIVLNFFLVVAAVAVDRETTPPSLASAPGVGGAPVVAASLGNLIVNGDFEFSSYGAGCHYNQSNSDVSANLSGIRAWGEANELDYLNNGAGCAYSGPPQSGSAQVAISRYAGTGLADEFCFELELPVVAGESCVVSFFVLASTLFDETVGAVEVGLSAEPTSFGTFVAAGLGGTSDWTYVEHQFVAPANAGFLCVRPESGVDSWNFVDNFTLSAGVVSIENVSWGAIRSMYR